MVKGIGVSFMWTPGRMIPLEEVIEKRELRCAGPSRLCVKTQKPPFKVWFSGDSPCKAEALGSSPTLAPVAGRGDPRCWERPAGSRAGAGRRGR